MARMVFLPLCSIMGSRCGAGPPSIIHWLWEATLLRNGGTVFYPAESCLSRNGTLPYIKTAPRWVLKVAPRWRPKRSKMKPQGGIKIAFKTAPRQGPTLAPRWHPRRPQNELPSWFQQAPRRSEDGTPSWPQTAARWCPMLAPRRYPRRYPRRPKMRP